jgi:hypothetical protein
LNPLDAERAGRSAAIGAALARLATVSSAFIGPGRGTGHPGKKLMGVTYVAN